jgi:hypothetical protein
MFDANAPPLRKTLRPEVVVSVDAIHRKKDRLKIILNLFQDDF